MASSLALAHMRLALQGRGEDGIAPADIQPAIDYALRNIALGGAGGWNILWMIHVNGWGVPADDTVALEHLRRGVEAGDDGARLSYARLLLDGAGGVARDTRAACALLAPLAVDGARGLVASHWLGLATLRGDCGGTPDAPRGLAMLERAAASGLRGAAYDLGLAYEYGLAGPVDMDMALEWIAAAADLGEPGAQWRIGMAWVRGEGRPRDSAKAVEWFERSAASDFENGLVSLAVMHATGDGVPQDSGRAAALYRRAADLGSGHALRILAGMQAEGEGMPPDPVGALGLYEQAIALGADEVPALRQSIERAIRASGFPAQH